MTIGDKLRDIRKVMGWSQPKLAEMAQLSIPTITTCEQGRAMPNLETLRSIARCLNMSLSELLEDVE